MFLSKLKIFDLDIQNPIVTLNATNRLNDTKNFGILGRYGTPINGALNERYTGLVRDFASSKWVFVKDLITTSLPSTLAASQYAEVDMGELTVTNSATTDNLIVQSKATVNQLEVSSNASIQGNMSLFENVSVDFVGDTNIGGNCYVFGETVLYEDTAVDANVTITGDLTVDGITQINTNPIQTMTITESTQLGILQIRSTDVILLNCSVDSIVTLPDLTATMSNKAYSVRLINIGETKVTIVPFEGQTIEGRTAADPYPFTLDSMFHKISFLSINNSAWVIL